MKKILLTLAAALLLSAPVLGDWVEEDGHKMHFPQLPNVVGWDVNATNPVVLKQTLSEKKHINLFLIYTRWEKKWKY